MKRFLAGVVIGAATAVLVAAIIVVSGVIDMGASAGPGVLETVIAEWSYERSVAVEADERSNPVAGDADAIAKGLEHYRGTCLFCHGAPGVSARPFAAAMSPAPPDLARAEIQSMPDGELFWTISHGIRMTGMPAMGATHSEEELWRIAAFVRELPELSEEQRRRLRGEVAPAKEAEPAVGAHEHEGHEHEAKGEEF